MPPNYLGPARAVHPPGGAGERAPCRRGRRRPPIPESSEEPSPEEQPPRQSTPEWTRPMVQPELGWYESRPSGRARKTLDWYAAAAGGALGDNALEEAVEHAEHISSQITSTSLIIIAASCFISLLISSNNICLASSEDSPEILSSSCLLYCGALGCHFLDSEYLEFFCLKHPLFSRSNHFSYLRTLLFE